LSLSIADIMRSIRNHFVTGQVLTGEWTAKDGVLTGPETLPPNGWIAVTGSNACRGVFRLEEGSVLGGMADGNWTGSVHLLSPPGDFLALCEEIILWEAAHKSTAAQESFGAYSRREALRPDGLPLTWEDAFASRLRPWRRMFQEVDV